MHSTEVRPAELPDYVRTLLFFNVPFMISHETKNFPSPYWQDRGVSIHHEHHKAFDEWRLGWYASRRRDISRLREKINERYADRIINVTIGMDNSGNFTIKTKYPNQEAIKVSTACELYYDHMIACEKAGLGWCLDERFEDAVFYHPDQIQELFKDHRFFFN